MVLDENRPDRSMDLLNEILQQPVDPDYARVAAAPAPPSRRRVGVALVTLTCGVMFAISAVQTLKAQPLIETEREELISQIEDQQARQDELRAAIRTNSREVKDLRGDALGANVDGRILNARLVQAEMGAAASPVRGPGIVVTVGDGPTSADLREARVVDLDLQQLVNGLWASGAEAVSVNGYRLSSTTAIRGAGDAITVNYRSLVSPYRVEAIGDPDTLEDRLRASAAMSWWDYLRTNFAMSLEIDDAKNLELAGNPGTGLRYAKVSTP